MLADTGSFHVTQYLQKSYLSALNSTKHQQKQNAIKIHLVNAEGLSLGVLFGSISTLNQTAERMFVQSVVQACSRGLVPGELPSAPCILLVWVTSLILVSIHLCSTLLYPRQAVLSLHEH